MAREIPEAVRAAAGLAATVLDEARRLPETLPGLPVRALGTAMQLSMKLQQHYADLVARGDELFTGLRGEREPGLATFDEDEEPAGPLPTAAKVGTSAFDRVAETIIEVTEDDAVTAANEALDELAIEELVDESSTPGGAEALADALLDGGGAAADTAGRDADGLPEPAVLDASPAPEAGAAGAGDAGTAEDAAIAQGAAVNAVGAEAAAPTDDPQGGSELAGSQAAGTAPVEGYDGWSIAQLRGRLRGYAPSTVQQLLDYEEATRARAPYLRMLRNRLERVRSETS